MTLLIVLGVLVVVVPLAAWAVAGRSDHSSSIVPLATGVPSAPPTLTASAPGQAPPTSAPGEASTSTGLPRHYTAVHLPRLAGSANYGTAAFGLNDRGQVVGQSEASDGRPHPVLWQNGRVIDLGVLATGPDEAGIARDINNRGDVVGGSDGPNGQRGVLWRNGQIIDLGTLSGGVGSFAYAINDRGQIVGTSMTATGELRGFLWENGQMRDLGISGGTIPRDINNLGQVVGALDFGDSGARPHAFLWQDGVVVRLPAPGISSGANAINDRGEIVGGYMVDIEVASRAVRWYRNTMTELGVLLKGNASGAAAINENGQILGTSNVAPHGMEEHAFIWWRGVLHDLTAAGVPEQMAYSLADINGRGQIVAGDTLFSPA